MADLNQDTIPFIPAADVALIETDTGKPKTAFHDFITALWGWMKQNVVDLTTKVTTLIQQMADAEASISEEQIARIEGDTALAAQITTVAASVDDATANGEIYFAAKAAPSGAVAAYGLHLTAGASYAGFEALAQSGGGSAIGMTANQFFFTDAGTQQPVFTYVGGGVWVLNGAFVIRSGTSGQRMVLTSSRMEVYDSNNVLRFRAGVW